MQLDIRHVRRWLVVAVLLIAVVPILAILATSAVDGRQLLVGVMVLGVSLAVAAVPEGLVTVLGVVLRRVTSRGPGSNAIAKKLKWVEALGATTVICTGKTGTLTKNEMTLRRVQSASGLVELTGFGYDPTGDVLVDGRPLGEGTLLAEVARILEAAVLASNARLSHEGARWRVDGDSTEGALLVAARKAGLDPNCLDQRSERAGEIPFSPERKLMSTARFNPADPNVVDVYVKGAPEVLLARCTHEYVGSEVVPLGEERRAALLAAADGLAADALRTLGIASRRTTRRSYERGTEGLEGQLVYLGTVGLVDPPRPDAGDAVARALRAGLKVVLITGEHPATASSIATGLGIVEKGADTATGARLQIMNDAELLETVRNVSVFARVAPEHTRRIVGALKQDGQVVAMAADEVRDASSLMSAADVVGAAAGTADPAVMDDDFATIVARVAEGRAILSDLRKSMRYLLTSNVGEVATIFFGVLLAGVIGLSGSGDGALVLPLLVTQILWINLLAVVGPAIAVGIDRPRKRMVQPPPRSQSDRLIEKRNWAGVLLTGSTMAAATLLTLDFGLPGGLVQGNLPLSEARTMAFTVLVLAQLFNVFNWRSESVFPASRNYSPWLLGAVVLSLALQVAVVHLPLLNAAFDTRPLDLGQWLFCFAVSSPAFFVGRIGRLLIPAWGPARRFYAAGRAPGGS